MNLQRITKEEDKEILLACKYIYLYLYISYIYKYVYSFFDLYIYKMYIFIVSMVSEDIVKRRPNSIVKLIISIYCLFYDNILKI